MKKVIVALDLRGSIGRRRLAGVISSCAYRRDWDVRIVHSAAEIATQLANRPEVDGIIVGMLPDGPLPNALTRTSAAVVLVGVERCQKRVAEKRTWACVSTDNASIGRLAAETFLTIGNFRSWGYLPSERTTDWSRDRQQTFAEAAPSPVRVFRGGDDANLGAWLQKLPKPAAVLAANDVAGLRAASVARRVGVRIPEQLALMGVDDNEPLCISAVPPLSSVRQDGEEEGAMAVDLLERLMSGRSVKGGRMVKCPATGVVERESTRSPAPASVLIRRARELVALESGRELTPDVLAARLGVSRRLLDLRFHEFEKKTVARLILDARLARFKAELRRSRQPVRVLADRCGFPNVNSLRNIFVRRYGAPPSAFRQRGETCS